MEAAATQAAHSRHRAAAGGALTLLDGGESVAALAEYLGHADPGFTLRTYTHLIPISKERTQRAIDGVFAFRAAA